MFLIISSVVKSLFSTNTSKSADIIACSISASEKFSLSLASKSKRKLGCVNFLRNYLMSLC
ncbi:MAG TPA: hypothetical protein PKV21_07820 [bacterium]|nr:hypothetical protein [bacterium]